MLISNDNKKHRIWLKMQHFIMATLVWVWIQLHIHVSIIKQWELGQKSTPVKKKIGCAKLKLSTAEELVQCSHVCTKARVPVYISVQSESAMWIVSDNTTMDGAVYHHVLLQFDFHIVPALGCSSIRHLQAQWNGTFLIAVTGFHVICLQDITHFTTVSHNIPAINQTVTLVSHHIPSRHCTRSTVSHDTPAINDSYIS